MKFGETIILDREIEINVGKKTVNIKVTHCHFFEVNKLLDFDRAAAYGYHLDIPSGTSVRFEPGETKEVQLCEFGGTKRIYGLNDLTCGVISEENKQQAIENAKVKGFIK